MLSLSPSLFCSLLTSRTSLFFRFHYYSINLCTIAGYFIADDNSAPDGWICVMDGINVAILWIFTVELVVKILVESPVFFPFWQESTFNKIDVIAIFGSIFGTVLSPLVGDWMKKW